MVRNGVVLAAPKRGPAVPRAGERPALRAPYLLVAGFLPTVRFTFEPEASTLPGLMLCFSTLPALLGLALRRVTLPALQSARPSIRLALFSFLPLSLGTTQPS